MTREEREKRKKQRQILHLLVYIFAAIGAVTVIVLLVAALKSFISQKKVVTEAPAITEEFLTVNEYSRPQIALNEVNGIVVHYTANPGTTADNNRSYFEGLATSGETYASSHFIIGLEGEVVQCVPLTEIAYASNDRNDDTISIECCHEDETGEFNEETYATLVHLTAYLMGQYDLEIDDVIRHYDVSGKNCPKYYVEHEDAWEQFKADVEDYIKENGERVKE
ncbi:MAG: peptidoglycan recognition protein family protein [Lachnospiraceae bacterium]|nr:peptidoglycan recognition protein family protein [Lachnospiraceae bacterium]